MIVRDPPIPCNGEDDYHDVKDDNIMIMTKNHDDDLSLRVQRLSLSFPPQKISLYLAELVFLRKHYNVTEYCK